MAVISQTPVDAWIAKRLGVEISELSQKRLQAWQLKAFRRTMMYAKKNSRFYKEHFKDVSPDDIRSMRDIEKLPFTSEDDLAENELSFQCVGHNSVSRVVSVSTTGTSNKIKRLSFSGFDQIQAMTFIGVGFDTMCNIGDSMLILMSGGTVGSIGDTVARTLEPKGIGTYVFGAVENIAAAYEKIRETEPNIIVGIPNQLAALAKYGKQFGNPERQHINSVLSSADFLPQAVREIICDLWQCDVFDHYGMTEMCIAGGVECRGFSGYHTRDCDLLFEVAQADETGLGEVVITTLDREAMPLIRYKTGDLARFTSQRCPCGSPMRRLDTICGRKRNVIVSGQGYSVSLTDIANAVYTEPAAIDYECLLSGGGNADLLVKVLPKAALDTSVIEESLFKNGDIAAAINDGKLLFNISAIEADSFEAGGAKKAVQRY